MPKIDLKQKLKISLNQVHHKDIYCDTLIYYSFLNEFHQEEN